MLWSLNQAHNVDCLEGLSALPSDSIDVAVTSPPYWGQRGAIGLGSERDPREYLEKLTAICCETMRVLKRDATLWLNLGDAYNTPINWREKDYRYSTLGRHGEGLPPSNTAYTKPRGNRRAFVDPNVGWLSYGNLLALPQRLIIALCDRGYLFRGEIVWQKKRPLPEGACRRPHRRHEGIYVFAKHEQHRFRVRPPVGSVWKLTQTRTKTAHTSPFPLELPMACIDAAGLDGPGVVLDPFLGSGTTGVAARLLGHDFVGFELDGAVCEAANARIAALRQTAVQE